MPRTVTLELVDGAGRPLGALAPFEVESPWWLDTGPAVRRADELFQVDVRVLHLLDGEAGRNTVGGRVRYLAELLSGATPRDAAGQPEPDDPHRPQWARPGGTAQIIRWTDSVLETLNRPRIGPVQQIRAWNLSSILRIDTAAGPVWCKSVPPFFAHEGAVIEWLPAIAPPDLPPRLLGRNGGNILLDDIPGEDLYDCPEPVAVTMIERIVDLHCGSIGRVDDLLALRLPDWRGSALGASVRRLRTTVGLTPGEVAALDELVDGLPERFAALSACGMPDTLVHGDPHPGNWRSDGRSLVLLDWGDCGVGHPLLDVAPFVEQVEDDARRGRLVDAFVASWRRRLPDSDPAAALRLVQPISALRQALVYQTFLDGIEVAEQVHHRNDVPDRIRRAIG
ncbi:MAG TPA: aminoglycoside phosphotransferase family protein [Mycobacteriales bacterium]|jgi:hypothetical protein|nr:aminoglycoside phosphotransferase family protein [Mycobacteriales bacterium]